VIKESILERFTLRIPKSDRQDRRPRVKSGMLRPATAKQDG
jgi:hypothetical protein